MHGGNLDETDPARHVMEPHLVFTGCVFVLYN
jgi:hypothetical protein